ncbi:MAG: cobalt-precorrin-5B (C(1))-methyltransferase CbiD [Anaerolineaceae bacterium]|nr:cobalt-precorrin-5B (C(1))-methyltransferase CbiD [Anaerolineaceae bacterium]
MLRTGFSTSACAAAAAAAALSALETGIALSCIEINLITMRNVCFEITRCERSADAVLCGVIKDSGDDPDVTNRLEIQAEVRRNNYTEVRIFGGKGVGVITLPGLPVEVGQPAINPGPRRLILRVFYQTMQSLGLNPQQGYDLIIHVPEGERVAVQTLNPKLGILGGISILGTDGLVHPYSAPAFRASLYYELKVAKQKGFRRVAFGTGKRSVDYLQETGNGTDGVDFISVGDELGFPIDQATRLGFNEIWIGGMIGKLSKIAQGRFQTHVQKGEVDFDFLANLAEKKSAPAEICQQVRTSRTARAVQNLLSPVGINLEPILALLAAQEVHKRCQKKAVARVWIFSLDGEILGFGEAGETNA